MLKHGRFIFLLVLLVGGLTGCLGTIWSGANMVYDRHDTYKKLNDYHIFVDVNNALNTDKVFKDKACMLDLTVFNGVVLIAGHVPSEELRAELTRRLSAVGGYKRLYNEVVVSQEPANNVQDSWITTKIRSQIFADSSIDPNAFKIITTDRIVYIMGDVKPDQAEKVVNMARNTSGVVRVVKIMKYYTYESK